MKAGGAEVSDVPAPMRVLLVEDNPGDARLLREILAEVGAHRFELTHHTTLAAALNRLSEGGIDVVLLDLSLPDSDGLDTFARAHSQAPGVPVVVLTGLPDDALAAAALREGAQDYLVKGRADPELLVRSMRYAMERQQAEEALFEQARELAMLGERNRMAREIHDTLAQGFTGIVIQIEAAEQVIEDSPEEVSGHLIKAKSLARESLQEARRSVWDLLPRALEGHSLEGALEGEVKSFPATSEQKVFFALSGTKRQLPGNVEAALLRVCQESLTNVRRYSDATEVEVSLGFDADSVRLWVRDNGIGFQYESVREKAEGRLGGFGLPGMEQRVQLLGGTFSVKSETGEGTLVEAVVPVGPDSK